MVLGGGPQYGRRIDQRIDGQRGEKLRNAGPIADIQANSLATRLLRDSLEFGLAVRHRENRHIQCAQSAHDRRTDAAASASHEGGLQYRLCHVDLLRQARSDCHNRGRTFAIRARMRCGLLGPFAHEDRSSVPAADPYQFYEELKS